MLFPALTDPPAAASIRVRDQVLSYPELARACRAVAAGLQPGERVAVLAERQMETVVAVVGALLAGAVVVPLNPTATARELEHQVADAAPVAVATVPGSPPPPCLVGAREVPVDLEHRHEVDQTVADFECDEPAAGEPALIMYTSGTTGPPKGAVLSRAALAANLDALAGVWGWRRDDVLVHALPLHHVHGLVLGVLLPVRQGTGLIHLGAFDPSATAAALADGATVHFGVPTIYGRLADAVEDRPDQQAALARARLLVSGSAGLPLSVHERLTRLTDHPVVERYGMTETLITTAVPAGRTGRAGTVGPPLPGVHLRLVDDDGEDVPADGESMGELLVQTPAMFSGYLNRPDETAAAFREGWFVTGDVATVDAEGFVRIVGRRSTDIIKSGGYKIGAGEIEDALLEHPAVAEVAVAGRPDDDLGERVTAWVVLHDGIPDVATAVADLQAHAAAVLAPYKRPRTIALVDALPRNPMGKVLKAKLPAPVS